MGKIPPPPPMPPTPQSQTIGGYSMKEVLGALRLFQQRQKPPSPMKSPQYLPGQNPPEPPDTSIHSSERWNQGRKLAVNLLRCKYCGVRLLEDDNICPHCGAPS